MGRFQGLRYRLLLAGNSQAMMSKVLLRYRIRTECIVSYPDYRRSRCLLNALNFSSYLVLIEALRRNSPGAY